MTRNEILHTAEHLIDNDRAAEYGPARKNFEDIAVGWEVIFGVPVTPQQVGLAMGWLKVARLAKNDKHIDSYIDAAAYMALAGELATETETADNVKQFKQQG